MSPDVILRYYDWHLNLTLLFIGLFGNKIVGLVNVSVAISALFVSATSLTLRAKA